MSLEQLRAQAEAEDETKAEQPEAEEEVEGDKPEAEQEESEEPEAKEAEESDDFELELEGEPEPDQQKYDPVEVLQHKLSRERKKKAAARSEVDELKDQIAQLTQMMQGGKQPQQAPQQSQSMAEPTIPDLYDEGINGDRQKYDAAMKKWFADYQAFQGRHKEAEQVQTQYREQMEGMTKSLAERAAKFASENKVKVDVVADALDKATSEVDQATGIDGSLAYLLDSVGDGSERVAYYIGRDASAMAKVKQLLQEDNKGFKAISHMTRLAEKLKPKHSRKISKAPEPDQPLRGDGTTGSTSKIKQKLQQRLDKAKTGPEMQEILREARKAKVSLDI